MVNPLMVSVFCDDPDNWIARLGIRESFCPSRTHPPLSSTQMILP